MRPLHPLINPNSSHYDTGEKSAIEILEENLTIAEMIGFCKGNIFKYEYRKEHKGVKEADEAKIETYKNYLALLEELSIKKSIAYVNLHTVIDLYKKHKREFEYR